MTRQPRIPRTLLAAAAGLAVLTPIALAGPASAHVPKWTLTCSDIKVDLEYYSDNQNTTNTVSLEVDGKTLVDNQRFGGSYIKDFPIAAHSKPLSAKLVVHTTEDPNGDHGWSVTKNDTVPVCESPSPSPSTHSPSPSPSVSTPAPSTSAPSTPAPSTTAPAPSPSPTGPQLAATGGGSSAPVLAAIGGGVIVLGGGVLLLTRRRANRH